MESLSPELARRLESLGLCGPRDLRRCRARVRRLSRDLPAFDSVWIDALVQARKLTPFQARHIAAGETDGLSAGPFVLTERLSSDGRLTIYRARRRDAASERVLLTVVDVPVEEQTAARERLQGSIARLRQAAHANLCLPLAANLEGERLLVASTPANGPTLGQLLVRRGRFPVRVVAEVARVLVSALAALERAGALHGDLRLRNVRLEPSGRVALLQAGVLAAANPLVTIHADIPPDCYDGVAPELIGTHQERTTASDLYALGCLLWELLAGRAPFTTGDPLAKLAAHQTRAVADVREWNPETPADLATLIARLTAREPRHRPASFRELEQSLGPPTAGGKRGLRRFARSFQSAAPRQTGPAAEVRPVAPRVAAALALLLAVAAGVLGHGGARSELLRIVGADAASRPEEDNSNNSRLAVSEPSQANGSSKPDESPHPRALSQGERGEDIHGGLRSLPGPGADGVVALTADGAYAAAAISTAGPLVVQGPEGGKAVIVVRDAPLRLTGSTVVLRNVDVMIDGSATFAAGSPVEVAAQDFGMTDCSVVCESGATASSTAGLISWRMIEPRDATGGRLGLLDTVFHGPATAIACATPPRSVLVQNSLKLGAGALLALPEEAARRALPITLRGVTLRESGGIVSAAVGSQGSVPRLSIAAERCVFQPAGGAGLIELRVAGDERIDVDVATALSITGEESLLQASSPLVVARAGEGTLQPLDAPGLAVEGLQYAELHFAGPPTSRAADSVLAATASSSPRPPGIEAAPFPQRAAAPYNSAEASGR